MKVGSGWNFGSCAVISGCFVDVKQPERQSHHLAPTSAKVWGLDTGVTFLVYNLICETFL